MLTQSERDKLLTEIKESVAHLTKLIEASPTMPSDVWGE